MSIERAWEEWTEEEKIAFQERVKANTKKLREQADIAMKRKKKVAKALGAYDYTPLTCRTLAGILVDLAMGDGNHRDMVLGAFQRIANGGTK